jgi:hypothetical protein
MNFLPAKNDTASAFKPSQVGQVEKCERCSSQMPPHFSGELAIHFTGLKGLGKPIVWVFPKLLVCLSCGLTEFTVPERELRVLRDGIVADGAMVWPRVA